MQDGSSGFSIPRKPLSHEENQTGNEKQDIDGTGKRGSSFRVNLAQEYNQIEDNQQGENQLFSGFHMDIQIGGELFYD